MKLMSYCYSKSGGMMGGHNYTNVKYNADGKSIVYYSEQIYHSAPTVTKSYLVEGLLEKLSEVCEHYNVTSWTNLPKSEMFAYDEPSRNFSFTFEDGTVIGLKNEVRFPDDFSEFYQQFRELIEESEEDGIDVKEETVKKDEPTSKLFGSFLSNNQMMKYNQSIDKDNALKKNEATNDSTPKVCPSCGATNKSTARFCCECGSIL